MARGAAGRDASTPTRLVEVVQRRAPIYDKAQDGHYNLISALHKCVRGSDPDAALYYLARMFDAGEDPLFIARRVVRMASEDIGLADPQALVVANAAKDAYDFLGSPEGELAIAEAVVYVATAPKSNAIYKAFGAAQALAKAHGSLDAAEDHPQRADAAHEARGLRRRLTNTTTTRPTPSAARTTGPRRSAAASSTSRSSAASSARSGSGSIIGRGSGRSGDAGETRRPPFPGRESCLFKHLRQHFQPGKLQRRPAFGGRWRENLQTRKRFQCFRRQNLQLWQISKHCPRRHGRLPANLVGLPAGRRGSTRASML